MPSLTPEEQKRLLGPVKEFKCPKCGQQKDRRYCRSCDEFFYVCACPVEPGSEDDHRNCRTY